MSDTPVLIVGAGPSGLVLALSLTRQGIPVRIIDKNQGPGEASRAIAVHARTLEYYAQLGFADEIISKGIKAEALQFRKGNGELRKIFLKEMGKGVSPFPYVLSLPQDEHEKILVEQLKKAGVNVEWGTALKSFTQDSNEVKAVLSKAGKDEALTTGYLCGCDGAHSRVREELNIGFPGGTYDQLFYVADVKTDKDIGGNLTISMGPQNFLFIVPVRTSGTHRLIGIVPKEAAAQEKINFEDIRKKTEPLLDAKVSAVNWFSTYRVHHRVADSFQKGRSFLLGDAGHIHSPAGGQGMNTGIGDAVNLSWKLAQVIKKQATPSLLGTYEVERKAFAKKLVSTTDKLFEAMVGSGLSGKFTRAVLFPYLMPIVTSFAVMRRMIFKTVSQVNINYHESALSSGKAGGLKGGDRLPWVGKPSGDNFKPLQSLDWQMHFYGKADPGFVKSVKDLGIPLNIFPADSDSKNAGIKPDTAYLIRPDGYISLALRKQDSKMLQQFIEKNELKFLPQEPGKFGNSVKPPSP